VGVQPFVLRDYFVAPGGVDFRPRLGWAAFALLADACEFAFFAVACGVALRLEFALFAVACGFALACGCGWFVVAVAVGAAAAVASGWDAEAGEPVAPVDEAAARWRVVAAAGVCCERAMDAELSRCAEAVASAAPGARPPLAVSSRAAWGALSVVDGTRRPPRPGSDT
jgi:hypothetical protein